MVLTHPHADHTDGFAELIERYKPQKIAVTGSKPLGYSLLDQTRGWLRRLEASSTDEELEKRKVVAALSAIERWEEAHPGALTVAVDPVEFEWTETRAKVKIHAPEPGAALDRLMREIAKGTVASARRGWAQAWRGHQGATPPMCLSRRCPVAQRLSRPGIRS